MYLLVIAIAAAMFYGAFRLLAPRIQRLLQRELQEEAHRPLPEGWRAVVRTRLPYIDHLPVAAQSDLLHHAQGLLTTREWEGCDGLALTDEMRLVIAAQAALLTWKRTELPFPRLKTILVYPTTFRPKASFRWVAERTEEEEHALLGQSWSTGTVVLAWDDVLQSADAPYDGHNVVLHEFAHQLDFSDLVPDGIPALTSPGMKEGWQQALIDAYRRLEDATAAGSPSPIDPYGLTSRAEFFAASTEAFFECPTALRRSYPELYTCLSVYYAQDPADLVGHQDGATGAPRAV